MTSRHQLHHGYDKNTVLKDFKLRQELLASISMTTPVQAANPGRRSLLSGSWDRGAKSGGSSFDDAGDETWTVVLLVETLANRLVVFECCWVFGLPRRCCTRLYICGSTPTLLTARPGDKEDKKYVRLPSMCQSVGPQNTCATAARTGAPR